MNRHEPPFIGDAHGTFRRGELIGRASTHVAVLGGAALAAGVFAAVEDNFGKAVLAGGLGFASEFAAGFMGRKSREISRLAVAIQADQFPLPNPGQDTT